MSRVPFCRKAHIKISTHNQRATVYNVIGIIRGRFEPGKWTSHTLVTVLEYCWWSGMLFGIHVDAGIVQYLIFRIHCVKYMNVM